MKKTLINIMVKTNSGEELYYLPNEVVSPSFKTDTDVAEYYNTKDTILVREIPENMVKETSIPRNSISYITLVYRTQMPLIE